MATSKIQSGETYISKSKDSIIFVKYFSGSGKFRNAVCNEISLNGFNGISLDNESYYPPKDISKSYDKTTPEFFHNVYNIVKSERKKILSFLKKATLSDFEEVEIGKSYIKTIDRKTIYYITSSTTCCEYDLSDNSKIQQDPEYYFELDEIIRCFKEVDNAVFQEIDELCENFTDHLSEIIETAPIIIDEKEDDEEEES